MQHLCASATEVLRIHRRGGQILRSRHLHRQFKQVRYPAHGHARPGARGPAAPVPRTLHLLQQLVRQGYAACRPPNGRYYHY